MHTESPDAWFGEGSTRRAAEETRRVLEESLA
jgi:hypothetical protein